MHGDSFATIGSLIQSAGVEKVYGTQSFEVASVPTTFVLQFASPVAFCGPGFPAIHEAVQNGSRVLELLWEVTISTTSPKLLKPHGARVSDINPYSQGHVLIYVCF